MQQNSESIKYEACTFRIFREEEEFEIFYAWSITWRYFVHYSNLLSPLRNIIKYDQVELYNCKRNRKLFIYDHSKNAIFALWWNSLWPRHCACIGYYWDHGYRSAFALSWWCLAIAFVRPMEMHTNSCRRWLRWCFRILWSPFRRWYSKMTAINRPLGKRWPTVRP